MAKKDVSKKDFIDKNNQMAGPSREKTEQSNRIMG